jgi:quercetin dioxygenase-like cupin family protein
MSFTNSGTTRGKVDNSEIFDLFGPSIQFLTPLSDGDGDYCLIRGTVPTGAVVPLHSHAERETFQVLDGQIEGYWKDHWITLTAGQVFDVPGGLRHGWRNLSSASTSLLIVAPMRLARFFHEMGRPLATLVPGAPKPEDFQRFVELASAYGYWLGGPADNAAAGLAFG